MEDVLTNPTTYIATLILNFNVTKMMEVWFDQISTLIINTISMKLKTNTNHEPSAELMRADMTKLSV